MSTYHQSVLLQEVLTAFNPIKEKVIIDATIGGAGHARALIEHGAYVLGIDADLDAVEEARSVLSDLGSKKWQVVHGNFRQLGNVARSAGIKTAGGILIDLGVASYQINNPEKGFSYSQNSPLDMRFDHRTDLTAAEILNKYSQEELYEIFSTYGEEKRSRTIALAVVRARTLNAIRNSDQLMEIIRSCVQGQETNMSASRIFQALRIAVNDELASLRCAIIDASSLLEPGGTLAVISFHSLEDRIVKLALRNNPLWEVATTKPIIASPEERTINPRSRSAKLRIAKMK